MAEIMAEIRQIIEQHLTHDGDQPWRLISDERVRAEVEEFLRGKSNTREVLAGPFELKSPEKRLAHTEGSLLKKEVKALLQELGIKDEQAEQAVYAIVMHREIESPGWDRAGVPGVALAMVKNWPGDYLECGHLPWGF